MTPTYSRYDDHSRKARQLTEYTDKHGAPYYEKVQGMLRSHYQQTKPNILLRDLPVDVQEEAQSLEDNQENSMTKEEALANLRKATDMPTKLMWQNVYFWFIRNSK